MRNLGKTFILIGCLVYLSALLAPNAKADQWDQTTTITFSQPVELPGISLPAGTYVFKMLDYLSNQDMVEVLSQDKQHVIGLFRTIPDYRVNNTTETSMIFEERGKGVPQAIKEWFFPDRHNGHEFVYPKPEALELARTEQPKQSAEPPLTKNEPAEVVEQTPPPAVAQLAPQPLPQPEVQQPPQIAEMNQPQQQSMPRVLPKTASFLPLTGLLGISLLAGAFGLRLYSGKNE
jgi:hypothetical protein